MSGARHLAAADLAEYGAELAEIPADARTHLASCTTCTAELAAWRQVADAARHAEGVAVPAPAAGGWAAVRRQLDRPPVAPGTRHARARRNRRRQGAALAVGLVVGLALGVGATLGVSALRATKTPDVLAAGNLAALPGESGGGLAELTRVDRKLQMTLDVQLGTLPADDFYEVWLINADGKRMYALGVLPTSGHGSYWVPSGLDDRLDGYRTVDVSLEPDNGDPTHSRHSLIRGQLY